MAPSDTNCVQVHPLLWSDRCTDLTDCSISLVYCREIKVAAGPPPYMGPRLLLRFPSGWSFCADRGSILSYPNKIHCFSHLTDVCPCCRFSFTSCIPKPLFLAQYFGGISLLKLWIVGSTNRGSSLSSFNLKQKKNCFGWTYATIFDGIATIEVSECKVY